MKQSEAVAIANNTTIILQMIQKEPMCAVDFVKSLLLKDPVSLKEAKDFVEEL